jgi:hypothetical protein
VTQVDLALAEAVPGFSALGMRAFTTTRQLGTFALGAPEPSADIHGRWVSLATTLQVPRLVFAHQIHGIAIVEHVAGWQGILRVPDADGHLTQVPGTAMAVSLADCVPVFLGHPRGVAAVVHSGWKGTAGRIAVAAVDLMMARGCLPEEVVAHCGPSICGSCYEVGPEVFRQLTGQQVDTPSRVDLRALIARDLRDAGVTDVSISPWCTRCHNERFFSHRAGDEGRQLGVLALGGGLP